MSTASTPAAKPFILSVAIQVAMTGDHLAGYGDDYHLDDAELRSHALEHLRPAVRDALSAAPTPLLGGYSSRVLTPARELSHQPYVIATWVKLTMTVKQQRQWAVEYGLDLAEVEKDVHGYIQAVIQDALDTTPCLLLRDHCTYSVSQPR